MYLSSGEMDRPVAVPLDRGYRDHLAGREAEKLDRSTAIRVGLPEIDSFADQRERVPGKGRQNFRLLTAAPRTVSTSWCRTVPSRDRQTPRQQTRRQHTRPSSSPERRPHLRPAGTPQAFTIVDAKKCEASHCWPEVLPGGKAVIFTPERTSESSVASIRAQRGFSWCQAQGAVN